MVLNGRGMTLTEMHSLADQVRAGTPIDEVMSEFHRAKVELEERTIKAGEIEDQAELLGTDKSAGAVNREGQELTTVDEGTDELLPGQKSKDVHTDNGDGTGTGQQTADLGGSGAPQSEDGAKAPAASENAQAGSTEAATGV